MKGVSGVTGRLCAALLVPLAISAAMIGCAGPASTELTPRAVEVASVRIDPRTASPVVTLVETDGGRRLPIWIGQHEAESIAVGLGELEMPRPNTHDLIVNILGGIRGRILRVVITDLIDNTYYALLDVEVDGREVSIDARPSDAIAVAIRTGTPLFAMEKVLRVEDVPPKDEPQPKLEIRNDGFDTDSHRRPTPSLREH